jgi:hypothetical protein
MLLCILTLLQVDMAQKKYELAETLWKVEEPERLTNVDFTCLDLDFCAEKAAAARAKHGDLGGGVYGDAYATDGGVYDAYDTAYGDAYDIAAAAADAYDAGVVNGDA